MSLLSPSQLNGTPSMEINGHVSSSSRDFDTNVRAPGGVQDRESTDETYLGGRSMEGEVAQELSPIAIFVRCTCASSHVFLPSTKSYTRTYT